MVYQSNESQCFGPISSFSDVPCAFLSASFARLVHNTMMSDTNGAKNGHAGDHYEKGPIQERRRSSVADLNRNKNLDAKYTFFFVPRIRSF